MYYLVKKTDKSYTVHKDIPGKLIDPIKPKGSLCSPVVVGWQDDNFIFVEGAQVGFTPFDSATQNRSGPVVSVANNYAVTETYTVINKTQAELDDEQKITDEIEISRSSNKEAMWVLVELIDQLLANNTIQAKDFTPSVRAAIQSLKSKVDAVKA